MEESADGVAIMARNSYITQGNRNAPQILKLGFWYEKLFLQPSFLLNITAFSYAVASRPNIL